MFCISGGGVDIAGTNLYYVKDYLGPAACLARCLANPACQIAETVNDGWCANKNNIYYGSNSVASGPATTQGIITSTCVVSSKSCTHCETHSRVMHSSHSACETRRLRLPLRQRWRRYLRNQRVLRARPPRDCRMRGALLRGPSVPVLRVHVGRLVCQQEQHFLRIELRGRRPGQLLPGRHHTEDLHQDRHAGESLHRQYVRARLRQRLRFDPDAREFLQRDIMRVRLHRQPWGQPHV